MATNADPKGASDTLTDRDRRALEQYLTVLDRVGRVRGADDLFLVVSESGSEYIVDLREGACECDDHQYRGIKCKHARRVEFATGRRQIPAAADIDIDDQLGDHVRGGPRLAMPDGGVVEADGAGTHAPDEDEDEGDDGVIITDLRTVERGDRVIVGDRSRPVEVVDIGVRTIRNGRIPKTIETPVVRVRGDWANAVDRVLAHTLTRYNDGPALEERDQIVACEDETLERGEPVTVRRVVQGDDSDPDSGGDHA